MSYRNEGKIKHLDLYNHGLKLYRNRQFQEASDLFKKILDTLPDDGPSKLYLQRCQEYIKTPPPENWNGVYIMTTK